MLEIMLQLIVGLGCIGLVVWVIVSVITAIVIGEDYGTSFRDALTLKEGIFGFMAIVTDIVLVLLFIIWLSITIGGLILG